MELPDESKQPFLLHVPKPFGSSKFSGRWRLRQQFWDRLLEHFSQFDDVVGNYAGAEYTNPIAAFAAMVTRLDNDVERIIDLLKQLEIEKNTLIIFTSDNGPHEEGGHDPVFFQSSGRYRGVKRDLYEGGIRVPTIVSWPGRIEARRESDHMSAFWDWLPTLCEIASIESDIPPNDGLSLVPTLFDQAGQQDHDELYWEFHEHGGKQAIRVGNWKAIRLNVGEDPHGPIELYDLSVDPKETADVGEKHPQLVRELADRMTKARTSSDLFQFNSGTFKP